MPHEVIDRVKSGFRKGADYVKKDIEERIVRAEAVRKIKNQSYQQERQVLAKAAGKRQARQEYGVSRGGYGRTTYGVLKGSQNFAKNFDRSLGLGNPIGAVGNVLGVHQPKRSKRQRQPFDLGGLI